MQLLWRFVLLTLATTAYYASVLMYDYFKAPLTGLSPTAYLLLQLAPLPLALWILWGDGEVIRLRSRLLRLIATAMLVLAGMRLGMHLSTAWPALVMPLLHAGADFRPG